MSPTPPDKEAPLQRPADYESTPLSRAEYISALVHMYRGELFRANAWRMRLDNTTNWAVIATAGLLSFSFGPGASTHWVILIGMPLVVVLHGIEARRYRLADVWRGRVRMIEENFYGPILRRDPESPDEDWGKLVAEDLFHPRLKLTRLEALRNRFTRNYWAIYLILIFTWVAHIFVRPVPIHALGELRGRLTTGLIPWWVPIAYIGAFALGMLLLVLLTPKPPSSESEYWQVERSGKDNVYRLDL
jgi:uncharacterized membrane protein